MDIPATDECSNFRNIFFRAPRPETAWAGVLERTAAEGIQHCVEQSETGTRCGSLRQRRSLACATSALPNPPALSNERTRWNSIRAWRWPIQTDLRGIIVRPPTRTEGALGQPRRCRILRQSMGRCMPVPRLRPRTAIFRFHPRQGSGIFVSAIAGQIDRMPLNRCAWWRRQERRKFDLSAQLQSVAFATNQAEASGFPAEVDPTAKAMSAVSRMGGASAWPHQPEKYPPDRPRSWGSRGMMTGSPCQRITQECL